MDNHKIHGGLYLQRSFAAAVDYQKVVLGRNHPVFQNAPPDFQLFRSHGVVGIVDAPDTDRGEARFLRLLLKSKRKAKEEADNVVIPTINFNTSIKVK